MNTVSHLPRVFCLLFVFLLSSSFALSSESEVVDLRLYDFFSLDGEHIWAALHNERQEQFVFRSRDGGANWTATKVPSRIWGMFFVSPDEGWAISEEGKEKTLKVWCVHTLDGGRTWQRAGKLPATWEIYGPVFDTASHGWIVGSDHSGHEYASAFVLESNDAGEHWERLDWTGEPHSNFGGIRLHNGIAYSWSSGAESTGVYELQHPGPRKIFDRESMGIAFGANDSLISPSFNTVYVHSGEAPEWENVLSDDTVFHDISFADAAHGCVVGNTIFCTADGGVSWTRRAMPNTPKQEDVDVWRLYLVDSSDGWAETTDGEIFETHDAAQTWNKVRFFDDKGRPLEQLHHVR